MKKGKFITQLVVFLDSERIRASGRVGELAIFSEKTELDKRQEISCLEVSFNEKVIKKNNISLVLLML